MDGRDVAKAGPTAPTAAAGEVPSALAIVCACCAALCGQDDAIPAHAAIDGIDWGAVLAVAERHCVVVPVELALSRAGLPVPAPLRVAARAARLRAMALARETSLLATILAEADVPALFVKGAPLAVRAFRDVGARHAADVDLVVAPEQVDRAWQALADAGYRRLLPATELGEADRRRFMALSKDSQHRHPDRLIPVELHWRLSDDGSQDRLPPPSDWQAVAIGAGRSVRTLPDDRLFVYLCIHGASHGWARLKWLVDVAALVAGAADGGAALWRAARRQHAEHAAMSAFLLSAALFGIPPPRAVDMPVPWRVRTLVAMAQAIIAAGGGTREHARSARRGWAEMTAKLLIATGPVPVWRVVRRLAYAAADIGTTPRPPLLGPLLALPRRWRRRRARRDAP